MQTSFIQLTKTIELAATGDLGGNDVVVVGFESGTPYTNLCMFASGTVVTVTAQPLLGGQNDGASTALAGTVAKKVFQTTANEIRPATTGLPEGTIPMKSALKLTNTNATPTKLTVFMAASTTQG